MMIRSSSSFSCRPPIVVVVEQQIKSLLMILYTIAAVSIVIVEVRGFSFGWNRCHRHHHQQQHQQQEWHHCPTTRSLITTSRGTHGGCFSSSSALRSTTSDRWTTKQGVGGGGGGGNGSQQQQQPTTFDPLYYQPWPEQFSRKNDGSPPRITLTRFLSQYVKDHPELRDLQNILLAVQMACKTISNLVNRAGLVYSIQNTVDDGNDGTGVSDGRDNDEKDYRSDGRYYSMKRLDLLSTNVLKNALKFTGTVQMIVPEAKDIKEQPDQHQPGVLIAYDQHNLACLDPLDGSGNADASICTGTVFGVFARDEDGDTLDEESLLEAVLQPANRMRAAGYCLYSSATVLVVTLGSSVYGFTLDPQIQEFVLTHDKLTIPARGNVYSCNEANSEGWVCDGWKAYLKNLKLGQGETKQRYALRYVGSMVGDVHRTLLYGGIFAYPSDKLDKPQGNLQLLYKSAPLAFVVHHAGGKAMDESGADLLDKCPERIHQKSPCFMGSPNDMDELKMYLEKLK